MAMSIGRLRKEDNRRIQTKKTAEGNDKEVHKKHWDTAKKKKAEYRKKRRRAILKDRLAGQEGGLFTDGPRLQAVDKEQTADREARVKKYQDTLEKRREARKRARTQAKLDYITPIGSEEEMKSKKRPPKKGRRKPRGFIEGRPWPSKRKPPKRMPRDPRWLPDGRPVRPLGPGTKDRLKRQYELRRRQIERQNALGRMPRKLGLFVDGESKKKESRTKRGNR